MADSLAECRAQLALANRILAREGIVDAFGHVSIRHPTDPQRFLLSRHRAPELVKPEDILEYHLNTEPVHPTDLRHYGERVIHGCIYQARPDVMAVCHHHAPAILAYAIARKPLTPVYHLGGGMGATVPLWDSRDDFGDTALVVVKPEEGRSLAKALGSHWTVMMGRHGATVVGTSLHELVFRTVFGEKNAQLQFNAHLLGHVDRLTAREVELAAGYNLRPGPIERAWDYFVKRVADAEAMTGAAPAPRAKPAKGAKPSRTVKTTKAASRKRARRTKR